VNAHRFDEAAPAALPGCPPGDGAPIDVSATARAAGIRYPVALTAG
jgi:hypothetical protein